MKKIITQGLRISVIKNKNEEYISLTDMAKFKDREATGIVIANWLSTKYTIQFMG
ncbi:MAG: DNA-binding protein, partial [Candidatus Portnoybacteria bacterium CG06_land_8_20_14_3_00_39_12]